MPEVSPRSPSYPILAQLYGIGTPTGLPTPPVEMESPASRFPLDISREFGLSPGVTATVEPGIPGGAPWKYSARGPGATGMLLYPQEREKAGIRPPPAQPAQQAAEQPQAPQIPMAPLPVLLNSIESIIARRGFGGPKQKREASQIRSMFAKHVKRSGMTDPSVFNHWLQTGQIKEDKAEELAKAMRMMEVWQAKTAISRGLTHYMKDPKAAAEELGVSVRGRFLAPGPPRVEYEDVLNALMQRYQPETLPTGRIPRSGPLPSQSSRARRYAREALGR